MKVHSQSKIVHNATGCEQWNREMHCVDTGLSTNQVVMTACITYPFGISRSFKL